MENAGRIERAAYGESPCRMGIATFIDRGVGAGTGHLSETAAGITTSVTVRRTAPHATRVADSRYMRPTRKVSRGARGVGA